MSKFQTIKRDFGLSLRTYINTYDSRDETMDALVEALIAGPDAFKGTDPIDSFCGMWDTRV